MVNSLGTLAVSGGAELSLTLDGFPYGYIDNLGKLTANGAVLYAGLVNRTEEDDEAGRVTLNDSSLTLGDALQNEGTITLTGSSSFLKEGYDVISSGTL